MHHGKEQTDCIVTAEIEVWERGMRELFNSSVLHNGKLILPRLYLCNLFLVTLRCAADKYKNLNFKIILYTMLQNVCNSYIS